MNYVGDMFGVLYGKRYNIQGHGESLKSRTG